MLTPIPFLFQWQIVFPYIKGLVDETDPKPMPTLLDMGANNRLDNSSANMLAEMKGPDRTESADSLATWESRYKNGTFCGCVFVR
jgi:hypothetical protein